VEFHEQWARALAEVLESLHTSLTDPDHIALERATKWVFVIHQLLLQTDDGRVGRRLEGAMRRRFKLFESCRMQTLVQH
jgi:hypothetical protein